MPATKTRKKRRIKPVNWQVILWKNVKKRKKYARATTKVPAFLQKKKERYFTEWIAGHFVKNGWRVHHKDAYDPTKQWVIGKGFPDLICVKEFKRRRKGRLQKKTVIVFIEAKIYGRYPDEEQIAWMDDLPSSRTFLVRTNEWREIRAVARLKWFATRK